MLKTLTMKHDALNQSIKNNPNGNGTDAVDVKENEKSNGDFVFRINLSSDSSGEFRHQHFVCVVALFVLHAFIVVCHKITGDGSSDPV